MQKNTYDSMNADVPRASSNIVTDEEDVVLSSNGLQNPRLVDTTNRLLYKEEVLFCQKYFSFARK